MTLINVNVPVKFCGKKKKSNTCIKWQVCRRGIGSASASRLYILRPSCRSRVIDTIIASPHIIMYMYVYMYIENLDLSSISTSDPWHGEIIPTNIYTVYIIYIYFFFDLELRGAASDPWRDIHEPRVRLGCERGELVEVRHCRPSVRLDLARAHAYDQPCLSPHT